MSKKGFVVIIEVQMAVLAETEFEAQQLALDNIGNEDLDADDFQVHPMEHVGAYPDGWEDDSILYTNGDEEVTLKKAWSQRDE